MNEQLLQTQSLTKAIKAGSYDQGIHLRGVYKIDTLIFAPECPTLRTESLGELYS